MANFVEYLKSLRTSAGNLDASTKLYMTVGNESCDMDSVASTIAYAYLVSLKGDALSLPLLQCNRGDLRLRQDVVWLFKELNIDPDDLIYQDDISAETLSGVCKLSITLVDHNSPKGLVKEFVSKIVKVIDHHERSEDTPSGEGVDVLLEEVGSCSTLVAERMLIANAGVVNEQVAALLLAGILLDTEDLKLQGRVTDKDCAVAEQLLPRVASTVDRSKFYSKLFEKRLDIAQLTTQEVLRKDFKISHIGGTYSFGFCTITSLLSEFFNRSNVNQDITSFYDTHKLDALLMLGVYVDCEITKKRRQIAIFRPSSAATLPVPHLLESLASVLEDDPDMKCDRIQEGIEGFDGVLLEQGNVSITRKQIIPKITKFVASVESEEAHVPAGPSPASAAILVHQPSPPLEPTVTVLTKLGSVGESKPSGTVHVSYKSEDAPSIPEYSFEQEAEDLRKHRLVQIGGEEKNIDMDIVQPYRNIIQHAGYVGPKRQALVVMSACYLPPHSLPNYSEVIEHVFFYIMSVLDKLVMDEYIIIYLHSGAPHNSMPSIRIFHKFYKMVDRRLRKQLMHLYIVHPTFWVKTMILLARPIISGKFWRKVQFISTLQDLSSYVSIDDDFIAAPVLAVDQAIMSRQAARRRYQSEHHGVSQKDATASVADS